MAWRSTRRFSTKRRAILISIYTGQRAAIVRQQVATATERVGDFQAHFYVLPGDAFLGLEKLTPHEYLRGELEVFDSVAQVDSAKDHGALFVFLSHQWLGHHDPDPQGVQLRAMKQTVQTIARDARVKPKAVRVWLDIVSIPQLNQPEQRLSIASLPTFASCSDLCGNQNFTARSC